MIYLIGIQLVLMGMFWLVVSLGFRELDERLHAVEKFLGDRITNGKE